ESGESGGSRPARLARNGDSAGAPNFLLSTSRSLAHRRPHRVHPQPRGKFFSGANLGRRAEGRDAAPQEQRSADGRQVRREEPATLAWRSRRSTPIGVFAAGSRKRTRILSAQQHVRIRKSSADRGG